MAPRSISAELKRAGARHWARVARAYPEYFAAGDSESIGARKSKMRAKTRASCSLRQIWDRLVECKGCDCVCYISSNAGQFANLIESPCRIATISIARSFSPRPKIASPSCNNRVLARRGGRRFPKRRSVRNQETDEAISIIREHRGYLGLLKHELGHEEWRLGSQVLRQGRSRPWQRNQ